MSSRSNSNNCNNFNMQTETTSCSKVPTVDLGDLGTHRTEEPSEQEWERVSRELEKALSEIGCAYLTNHGIPENQINGALSSAVDFFKMDNDTKLSWSPGKGIDGYIKADSERYSSERHELKESFIFNPGDFSELNREAPPFMTTVMPLHKLLHGLSLRLMTTLAQSLGKPRDYFVKMHLHSGTTKGSSVYRFNYYPEDSSRQEDVTGFGAHNDFSTFTVLFSNDSKGFQVRDSAGQWLDVPFVPGTVLLLAGEFLHFYSNKRFVPVMHRVVLPGKAQPGCPQRCVLAYFLHADEHVPMWPPSSDNAPPSVMEYLMMKVGEARY